MCVKEEKTSRMQKTRMKRTDFSRTTNAILVTGAHGRIGRERGRYESAPLRMTLRVTLYLLRTCGEEREYFYISRICKYVNLKQCCGAEGGYRENAREIARTDSQRRDSVQEEGTHAVECGSVGVVIGESTSRDTRGRTDGCNLSRVQIINRVGEARNGGSVACASYAGYVSETMSDVLLVARGISRRFFLDEDIKILDNFRADSSKEQERKRERDDEILIISRLRYLILICG